jgi:hypothetical protein
MGTRQLVRAAVNTVLPHSEKPRRLRFGLARGVRMMIDTDRHLTLYFGAYERELNKHFRRLVRPGYKAFDVGGHNGYDALLIANLSHGPVVSFECDPDNIELMRKNFALNSFDIEAVQGFVSSRNGAAGEITLDEMANRKFMPDLIKMDIEGAEADALRGATHIMQTAHPAMILEVHGQDVENQCIEILRDNGYSPKIVNHGKRLIREQRGDDHNRWLVCEGRA